MKTLDKDKSKLIQYKEYHEKEIVLGRFLYDSLMGSVILKNENRIIIRVPTGNYFAVRESYGYHYND